MTDWNLSQLLAAEKIGILIRTVVLLLVGIPAVYIASRWLQKHVTKKYSAQQGMIASKILLYVGIAVILISELNELGFKLTHLIAAAGVLGIAIGFAAQTSFSNIISGFFLIAEQSFVVGDIVSVGSTTGEVLAIDMLSIKLRTFENKFVRIPNETILKSEVTNITHFPIRRLDLNIGVAYKEDIGRVRQILIDVAKKNPLCLQEPEAEVRFSGFGNSSIDLLLVVWVEKGDFLKVKNDLQEEVKRRFDQEGVEMPFPHVSVYKGSVSEPFPVHVVAQS
ncbi:mechanosensitive ion channel family protein [candidate division KSB1 bacterium]|nr:mechanosensitive ion channel family protein [candidate division KSB1 bacterium]NIR68626.1 mechanosensitive ion channel family protein [candidate division KSB1 bacterium]NIS28196.1 mechanosensitive ion channel family protein [candidate division KSB1 bacterium]NIT75087.1 mechanosensitive ion channel family protein [candidate division KSB1 bacterium]NIU28872.1 mechanosensitive ion channel family protein [candidate division KSB1 bacterium]